MVGHCHNVPEKLFIYEIAHGADSIETHLQQLHGWDINPGFIGLELPSDGKSLGFRKLLKWSPATAIALYIAAKIQLMLMSQGASSSSRGHSEYEAGRQFGEQIDASVQKIDRSREAVFRDYLTWKRCIVDSLLMLAFALCGLLTFLFLLVSLLILPLAGISIDTLVSVPAFLLIAFLFCLISLHMLTRVTEAFRDGIRDARDEKMFSSTVDWCNEEGRKQALIIAGKAHSSRIRELAEESGVDVEVRSAPSVEGVDGDSFGLSEVKKIYLKD